MKRKPKTQQKSGGLWRRPGLFIIAGALCGPLLVWAMHSVPVDWRAAGTALAEIARNPWAISTAVGAGSGWIAWLVAKGSRRSSTVERGTEGYSRAWWVLAIPATAGIVVALWLLPAALVSWDISGSTTSNSDRLAAIATARQALLWAAGGLLAVLTIALTWRRDATARLTVERERDENYTSRYTTAIAELGDDKHPVKLGGIYALERIAADSIRDRQTILNVLVAYLLDSSPWQENYFAEMRSDIAAAIKVVGRITQMTPPDRPIYLAFTHLDGADLRLANFENATMHQTTLTGSELDGINLRGAHLHGTHFGGSNLKGADLSGASLYHAKLMGANLLDANLAGARLEGADLYGADLQGADLRGADLRDANLSGAKVRRRSLEGVQVSAATTNPVDADTGHEINMQTLIG